MYLYKVYKIHDVSVFFNNQRGTSGTWIGDTYYVKGWGLCNAISAANISHGGSILGLGSIHCGGMPNLVIVSQHLDMFIINMCRPQYYANVSQCVSLCQAIQWYDYQFLLFLHRLFVRTTTFTHGVPCCFNGYGFLCFGILLCTPKYLWMFIHQNMVGFWHVLTHHDSSPQIYLC